MRLKYFRLENYIGIYNGLGLNSIEIDFTRCRHNILMIIGDNGSGKSTILRALNPLPDSSGSFISNKPARKVISYIDRDGTEYMIEYVHAIKPSGARDVSKGYIRKSVNGELIELNPNGNISSCKDILYTELGLDSNFVSLSEIGCENRGIATKKPAERKQYINYLLDNLEAYNNIHKNLNKKSSIFKSMINSINTKIANLGNPEMINTTLVSLNNRIDSLNIERDNLIRTISEDKAKINILDPDGSIQSKAQEIDKELSEYKIEESTLKKGVESLVNKYHIDISTISSTYESINRTIIEKDMTTKSLEENIESLIADREKENKALTDKQARLNSLNSDSHFETVKSEYDKTKANIETYIRIMDSMGLSEKSRSMSSAELISGINSLMNIKDTIGIIKSEFDYSTTEIALKDYYIIDIESERRLQDEIKGLDKTYNENSGKIVSLESQLPILKILDKRPQKCNIDDCPFISNAVELSNQHIEQQLENLYIEQKNIEEELNVKNDMLSNLLITDNCKKYINEIIKNIDSYKNILSKLPNGDIFSNADLLFKKFFSGSDFSEIDTLHSYLDVANTLDLYNEAKKYLASLETEIKTLEYKKQIIDEIVKDIETINTNLSSIIDKIVARNFELQEHKKDREVLSESKLAFDSVQESLSKLEVIQKNLSDLDAMYKQIENNILEINSLIKTVGMNESKLLNITNDINPMLSDRDKLVHSLKLLEEYNTELTEYRSKYDKVEAIKYYSSPNSGIQLIFINLYMSKTVSLANELLSIMFNGNMTILPFIINEKEFRIPCTSGGLPSDDITSMSNSQICMISTVIQFALLYQSSTKLNIPRLDEIDSGLDSFNRSRFVEFLNELMYKLEVDQAVIISHTNEIMDTEVDIILLRNDNSRKEITGNIIYDYNNN